MTHLAEKEGVPVNVLASKLRMGLTPQMAVYQSRVPGGTRFSQCQKERMWLARKMGQMSLSEIVQDVPMSDKERLTILSIYGERKRRYTLARELGEHPYKIFEYEKGGLRLIRKHHEKEWEPDDTYKDVVLDKDVCAWFRLQILQYGFKHLMSVLKPTQEELFVLAALYMEGKNRRAVAGVLRHLGGGIGMVVKMEMDAIQRLQTMDLGQEEIKLKF